MDIGVFLVKYEKSLINGCREKAYVVEVNTLWLICLQNAPN
jgi:hypothetical protein